MNYLLRHLKCIANFLAALMLLQSCVIYSRKPTPISEIPPYGNPFIKIITVNDEVYKVRWIEEENENIISISNTKRYSIDTSKIVSVRIADSKLADIPLKMAHRYDGPFEIRTKKRNYNLMKIELHDYYIRGYQKIGKDTYKIEIPIDQISEIRLNKRVQSKYIILYLGVAAAAFVGTIYLMGYLFGKAMEDADFTL